MNKISEFIASYNYIFITVCSKVGKEENDRGESPSFLCVVVLSGE